jgi:hypothetical protein
METLLLVGLLLAIVVVGYAVVNVVLSLLSEVLTFFQGNRLPILVVLAIILVVWLVHRH